MRRSGAFLGGLFLLFAQLAVAAHGHSFASTVSLVQPTDAAVGSCPLCAFAAHDPLAVIGLAAASDTRKASASPSSVPPRFTWCPPVALLAARARPARIGLSFSH